MIEKFSEVKNADIFIMKSYVSEPGFGNVVENFAYILTWIFVDLPFFLLDLVVSIFLVLMKIFENLDVLKLYEQSIYNMTKSVWQNFSGGNGIQSGSLLWSLLAMTGFYLFLVFLVNHSQFIHKLKHTLIVIVLLLSYFGMISGTGGGLYVFQTIRNVAQESVEFVSSMNFTLGKEKVTFENHFSDTYLRDTVYASYLYVNSGSLDGSYISKDGKKVYIDNSQLLGKQGKDGQFKKVSNEDRKAYLKKIGKDELGQNVFLAPTLNKVFLKFIFVLIMILKAIILAIPILFVYFLKFLADLTFLVFMVAFPFSAILSFIPAFQNAIFNVVKMMFVTAVMPFFGGLLLIIISLINKMITNVVISKVDSVLNENIIFESFSPIIVLTVFVVVSGGVYYVFWKYKESLITFLLGTGAAHIINQSMEKVTDKVDDFGLSPQGFYDKVTDISGRIYYEPQNPMSAQDNWNSFQEDKSEEIGEENVGSEEVDKGAMQPIIERKEALNHETNDETDISVHYPNPNYDNNRVSEFSKDIVKVEQAITLDNEDLEPDVKANTLETDNDISLREQDVFQDNQTVTTKSEKYVGKLDKQDDMVFEFEESNKQKLKRQTRILGELEKLRKKPS